LTSTKHSSPQEPKAVAQYIEQLANPSYIKQTEQAATVFDEYEAAKERLAQWKAADPSGTPTEIALRDEQLAKAQQNFDAVEAKYHTFRGDFGDVSQTALPPTSPSISSPTPLTTSDVAHSFAGLRWRTADEWKKPLGDKRKWLQGCIVTPGKQGVSETRWNPVLIGAALVGGRHVTANSVRAKFQTQPLLQPWLEAWKSYEADNFDGL